MNREPEKSSWRERLDQHESPLDTEQFWAGLEPKLPKPEKKRRVGIIWWPLTFVLLGMMGYWVLSSPEVSTGNSETDKSFPKSIESPSNSNLSQAPLAIGPDALKDNSSASNSLDATTSYTTESNNINSSDAEAKRKTVNSLAFLNKNDGDSRKNKLSVNDAPPGSIIATDIPSPSVQMGSIPLTEEVPMVHDQHSKSSENKIGLPAQNPLTSTTAFIGRLALLPLNEVQYLQLPAHFLPKGIEAEALSPQKKKRARPWSVDFQTGPGFTKMIYTDVSELAQSMIDNRQKTETPLESWSTAIQGRWTSQTGVFVQAGVAHTRMNSRLDWTNTSKTNRWGLATGFILEANGTMTPWEDSAWVVFNEVREVQHYNRIDILDLPLAAGYQWGFDRWQVNGAMGILLNLSQTAKGRSVGLDGMPEYWDTTPVLAYAKRLELGYLAQARVMWKPSNGWGVFVQPLVQYRPGSHTDYDKSGYNARSWSVMLQFGSSYSF
jgi:hypothetical protein